MMKAKSYFTEILIKLILMLCVPLFTILVVFWQADKIVKEQVQVSATKTLKLYSEQMDMLLDDVRNACITAFSNEKCQNYYTETVGSAKQVSLTREISQLLNAMSNESFYDIFVYYYRDDRIVSGMNASLHAEYYYDTYYSAESSDTYYSAENNPDFEAEFMNIIRNDSGKLTCHVMNSDGQAPLLCATMGKRSWNPQSNYTICVVLDAKYMDKMFGTEETDGYSFFQMYNSEKMPVMTAGVQKANSTPEAYVLPENMEYNHWLDSNGYMLQLKESRVMDNYYAYIVAKDYFWDSLQWLRNSSLLIVLFCVIVSIAVAYTSAKKAYSPVKDIMSLLPQEKLNEFGKKKKSEFAYIESFLKDGAKKNSEVKKELMLLKALDGNLGQADKAMLSEMGSFVGADGFMISIFQVEEEADSLDELCSFIVQNVFKEICGAVGTCYFLEVFKGRFVFIVGSISDYSKLCAALEEGQRYVKQFFKIVLTVGCSNLHKDISEMPAAYKEAKEALRYGFLVGLGERIHYGEIREKKQRYQSERESKVYMLLSDCVRREDSDINSFLEDLMYIYQIDEEASVDVALFFKNKVCHALEKLMDAYKADVQTYDEMLKALQKADTLDEFREQLSLCVAKLREAYRSKVQTSPKKEICRKAKCFIDENYADSQMSVNSLGEHLGIQAAYLSRVFREEYGISILNYLASVRITHAKRIIVEEDKSIQEVTEETGFSSSHVFIRTFKKLEGITPGKYKEAARSKEELL